MSPVKFFPEVLGAAQDKALRSLGPALTPVGFYLAGRTALALQLGHRHSVDLDWFAEEMSEEPEDLAKRLRAAGVSFVTKQQAEQTLYGQVGRVRVSMIGYVYPMLRRLVVGRPWACRFASLQDLAAMKLSAVAQRGAKKDYVDLFALLHEGTPLRRMLDWYRRKYSVEDIGHLLRSLTYFDDADDTPMPAMLWDVNWRTVKAQMRRWVEELAD